VIQQKVKASFMFTTPDADPDVHKTIVSTPEMLDLIVVEVKDYQQAASVGVVRFDYHPLMGFKSGDDLLKVK
jgi:hypothetical protein